MWPNFTPKELLLKDYQLRQELLVCLLVQDIRYVFGHVEFNKIAYQMYKDKYKFITIMREPVSRYISNYFYDFEKDSPFKISVPLEKFIETDRGILFGRRYSEYFSSLPPTKDLSSAEAIERSKENLHSFSIVGFLDDIDGFALKLKHLLGINLTIGHKNKGSLQASKMKDIVTPGVLKRIEKICAPDIEIYEYALSNFKTAGIR
jgi:hypothetical protein